jgi:hypothetical protein
MKTFCPVCSDVLLRHLCQSKILWFCLRCHQEMPNVDSIKFNAIQEKSSGAIFACFENNKE